MQPSAEIKATAELDLPHAHKTAPRGMMVVVVVVVDSGWEGGFSMQNEIN